MPQCQRCQSFACDGRTVVCKGCGTEQCHNNGLGRGACSVCLYGILPGWSGSDRACGYKGCTERASFGYVPGSVKSVCHTHASKPKVTIHEHKLDARGNPCGMVTTKITLADYIARRLPDARRCRGVVMPGEASIRRVW